MGSSDWSLLGLLALVPAASRWLRVAQREHYLAGTVGLFARRWWTCSPVNLALAALLVAATVASVVVPHPVDLAVGLAVVAVGPWGLSVRGRTSKLAWTRRLRTLTGVLVVLVAVGVGVAVAAGEPARVVVPLGLLLPVLTDLALLLAAPVERRLAQQFVDQATKRLGQVRPTVVAITGSFGKTTVKGYVRHLASPARATVATPASFNNTAGLSRAINEHLVPGTQVFVAEVGTYGPGEIREICSWLHPTIAAITNIGPVHLERMGSIETIVAAKSEILEGAEVAVLNVDVPALERVAADVEASGRRVVRCATTRPADVTAEQTDGGVEVRVGGTTVGTATGDAIPINVATAVGIAVALDVPAEVIGRQVAALPSTEHRAQAVTSTSGLKIIDDTYNSNPEGARAALRLLTRTGGNRRVLVTPGMVELGHLQAEANETFAREAAAAVDTIVVVGRTNAAALKRGASGGTAELLEVGTRDEAVEWVRRTLAAGDVVLYENDLPDHYP